MILIIGNETEAHSKYMYDNLLERKIDTMYFDSSKYPENIAIAYNTTGDDGYLIINGRKVMLSEIQGVYWRWYYGVNFDVLSAGAKTEFISNMVYRERKSALESLFCILQDKCNMVNSLEAVELHRKKSYQLNIMTKNKIRTPNTMITNDVEALREFYEENDKSVIFKPVLGGAFTKKLTEKDFKKENLDTLKTSPVQLQEFVDGTDIRAYAMNNNVFAAEIHADTVDFRESQKQKLIPIELPKEVQKDCLKILKLLKLAYSGIDIRKNKKGEYVFIEANPAPMFTYYESVTKYPITDNLIQLLTKEK